MVSAALRTQAAINREFAMTRQSFDPKDFGVEMEKAEFIDMIVDDFNDMARGGWSVDEMLLHPREAPQFCDDFRRKHGFMYAPDDIMLRSLLQRRKNPGG
jgi:hypothetical protein